MIRNHLWIALACAVATGCTRTVVLAPPPTPDAATQLEPDAALFPDGGIPVLDAPADGGIAPDAP